MESKEAASSLLSAEQVAWLNLGRPQLVLAARRIELGSLNLTIHMDNKFLNWVYNSIISLFNKAVKNKIQKELLDALDAKTDLFLSTVNGLSQEYWPLLLSLTDANRTEQVVMEAAEVGVASVTP
eukprot:TRINITY_DN133_c0_g2_i5.p1 TRINITY_DN133_c0_g2~~TRINITY_DN133_c0_g2_i5.p1  ORF type:complete len:125 (-),score=18.90 TRINITY_DN133_c0_g2_i5:637-1011(-)